MATGVAEGYLGERQVETGTGSKQEKAMPLSHRQELVLAALATAKGADFAPVQVQKLFFLIDENLASELGGQQFAFEPYDYGPFDAAVYAELRKLSTLSLVSISGTADGRQRVYALTPTGQELGAEILSGLPEAVAQYLHTASDWVRSLSFAQLVGSIYKAYPRMREKSIFQD